MRRAAIAIACLSAAALLGAGCGNERQDAPRVASAAKPSGLRTERLRPYGVTFTRPRNWTFSGARAPQLGTVGSGLAIVNLWRYRRVERLPKTNADLVRTRKALVSAVRKRDRSLRVLFARGTRVGGIPAVTIIATEKVGLARRKVRSTHLYAHGTEIVVDAYAPLAQFAQVDRTAFIPLVRSVRLTEPPARRRS